MWSHSVMVITRGFDSRNLGSIPSETCGDPTKSAVDSKSIWLSKLVYNIEVAQRQRVGLITQRSKDRNLFSIIWRGRRPLKRTPSEEMERQYPKTNGVSQS